MRNNIRKLAVLAIVAMLLTLVPLASIAESKMTVTGDFVNFRASYAGGGKILACLRKGTVVTKLSNQIYNGGWYHVSYNGQSGYIWGQYLKDVSSSSNNKENTSKTTTTDKTTNTKDSKQKAAEIVAKMNAPVVRNNDTVRATVTKQTNIRSAASTAAKIVATLKTRTTVSVLSRKNNYVYITTSKVSGYVPANSVVLNNTKAQTVTVKKTSNGNYKVYAGSTGTGKVLATVNVNSKITLLHQGSNWSYVKVGNVYGYISKNVYTKSKASN